MLTKKDLQQIENHGLSVDSIVKQLETFARGIPYIQVITAASVGNGIEVIPEKSGEKLIELYEKKKNKLEVVKFVPASGAATRMFQFLHQFLEEYNPEIEKVNKFIKNGDRRELERFFSSLKDFAFVNDVRKKIRINYPDYKHCTKGTRWYYFVKTMLEERGLNYSNLPKGLVPFHKYSKYATTAFEEQLYEAAFYASVKDEAFLHFTFSEDHVPHFKNKFNDVQKRVSRKTKTNFNISYSFQKKETDTIAVTPENKPFRDEENNLVFRPSGHGALLENLNEIDADIIFIKNIDNVVAEEYVEQITAYKKLLAGKLLWLQQKVFAHLRQLDNEEISAVTLNEIKSFLWNELSIKDIPESAGELKYILNRPIRVCGVVKNTGAPGGGPFWVKSETGNITLQIVETAQIDMNDSRQGSIVAEATHFNPVDIVCGVRDYNGDKFNLTKFTNPKAGFISEKSQNGKHLKALELPGLWNGGMANWNTALVEVPIATFNPVKTVNDLLQKEHRPNA
ncbi:uncharacterized protein DUF4301 [Ulvibacter sp. MAR_2010_11]|uniref:DUF4301 family protein n=1 Tax=Ulvibacter sp. MAR_2010_11 TaxID=1250229 RepID=UPI000C2BF14B|nr:DUF4301 family protein [Ulvibacter sp. MAR_2010_11]PKA82692.1 uncharacterized protein DUF4301 [Ulvibacter sp. MAR_2010_11]